MNYYLGQQMRGFKFDYSHNVGYTSTMNKYIGEVGRIVDVSLSSSVRVRFDDGEFWNYPIELIENHLIIKTMTYSEVKALFEELTHKEEVKKAIDSIKFGYVELDEIIFKNYFKHYSNYYSEEEYVVSYNDGVLHIDEAFYCEGLDEYVHYDSTAVAYEGRGECRYSKIYLRQGDFHYYNGDYYDDDALENHDIVWLEDDEEYAHRDDAYYDDNDGCYYGRERELYVRGYHNGSYQSMNFDGKSKFKIGYEIEKEDETVRNSIRIDDFEEETQWKWRKEKDGSLDDEAGYELISPTFEFNINKIFEHIEGNGELVSHINAQTSTSCGGHIHLSETGLTGNELFDKIKGYTPLFYALYYGRVNKTYAKGKSNRDLENENEKYQAIKIHYDRVEFRIISAVPNVKTLKWRSKLLMMILQNPTNDIIKAYYNVDTKFTKLLKQTYSDEKLIELKDRFIKFTKEFENLDIKNNN